MPTLEQTIATPQTTYTEEHTPKGQVRGFSGTNSNRTVLYDDQGNPVFQCALLEKDGIATIYTGGELPEGIELEDLRLAPDQTLSLEGQSFVD